MTKARSWSSMVAARAATLAALAAPTAALAAEYEKVEGTVRENIPAGPFLATAYGVIWAAVVGYVVYVARRLARAQAEIEELKRKLGR